MRDVGKEAAVILNSPGTDTFLEDFNRQSHTPGAQTVKEILGEINQARLG
jgi:hypothetical protein